jgi:predicted DNA-binding ribbon-helix-helix protein
MLRRTGPLLGFRRRSANCNKRVPKRLLTISTGTGLKAERPMKSPVVKRSIVIAGHKTSVSLEDAFWKGLKEIADQNGQTLSDLVAGIDSQRKHGNLSSAIRLFVLDHYRGQSHGTENGSHRDITHMGAPALRAD